MTADYEDKYQEMLERSHDEKKNPMKRKINDDQNRSNKKNRTLTPLKETNTLNFNTPTNKSGSKKTATNTPQTPSLRARPNSSITKTPVKELGAKTPAKESETKTPANEPLDSSVKMIDGKRLRADISEYELQRYHNIVKNNQKLAEMGFTGAELPDIFEKEIQEKKPKWIRESKKLVVEKMISGFNGMVFFR